MGYDLHITRADDWTAAAAHPITAEEWLAIVRADPEFALDPANGPYFANWTGTHSRQPGWLDWTDGRLYTKQPDSALLRKMVQLAARLGANVQGDDGERYTGDEPLDEWIDGADERTRSSTAGRPAQPWWRRLFGP